ncbi:MAG TPA: hypothetical protein VLA13_08195 [Massilibacterium sp.]|nr:hypothetical protein [Massilibacterium sp.]
MDKYLAAAKKLKKNELFEDYEVIYLAGWIKQEHNMYQKRYSLGTVINDIIRFAENFTNAIKEDK